MRKLSSKWTPKALATLARMLRAGNSSSQIAKAMNNVTRNAVLGKIHRLRKAGVHLPTKSTQGSPKARPKAPLKAAAEPKARLPKRQHAIGSFGAGRRPATEVLPRPVATTPHDAIDPQTPGLLRMMDLQRHHCRWPLNNAAGGEYYFCGDPKAPGRPYCSAHAAAAYCKPGVRQHAKVH